MLGLVERLVERSREVDPGSEFAFWTGLRTMHAAIAAAWRGRVDEAAAVAAAQGPHAMVERTRALGAELTLPAVLSPTVTPAGGRWRRRAA